MGIKILVCWEKDDEIERAVTMRGWIDDLLDEHNLHVGQRTVNIPPKTLGLIVPDYKKGELNAT